MFSTEEGTEIAIVRGGESNGEIIFLADDVDRGRSRVVKQRPVRIISVYDGIFEQAPTERTYLIAGMAGSGKSTYVSKLVKNFQKMHHGCKIFLFSRIDDDPAFEGINFKRIPLTDDLIDNPLDIKEVVENSLIVFDDIDTLQGKLLDSVYNFIMQLLELGRHKNVKVLITSHLIIGHAKKLARTILNELQSLTIFPQSGSVQQITHALKTYFGFNNKQIEKVLSYESRWVTIIKKYPSIVISEHKCIFVSQILKEEEDD